MMSTVELAFEGQTSHVARRSLAAKCQLFIENRTLLERPSRVRSGASEACFRLFQATIEGVATQIGMENAMDLEPVSGEFQFVELRRQVGEFVSQHPHIEVLWLKSAMPDLQRQLAGQNRELCQLAEANGLARAERDSQLGGLRGAIDQVAKKQ
jgi:hypothetical protein